MKYSEKGFFHLSSKHADFGKPNGENVSNVFIGMKHGQDSKTPLVLRPWLI